MPLVELIARLERDAKSRADAIAQEARAEAAAIGARAEQASSRSRSEELTRRGAERRARLAQELSAARAKARAADLGARQRLIERVFARAHQRLEGPQGAQALRELLPRWVAAAQPYFEREPVRRDGATGVTLAAADGSLQIELSLANQLEHLRQRLSIELLKELPP